MGGSWRWSNRGSLTQDHPAALIPEKREKDVIERLVAVARKPERLVIGLMSGTSMDGVDAALVRIRGGGMQLEVELERFHCHAYEGSLRERLLEVAAGAPRTAVEYAGLDFAVASSFAQAALQLLEAGGRDPADVDLVGSHGQTLAHRAPGAGVPGGATWQAGSPSVLAALLGMPVIGDFRSADVALGGTGAPLVPLADYLLRRSPSESRMLLNVGGIANFTYLRAGGSADEVCGWDVGPGNMVLDGFARALLGRDMDVDGIEAAGGHPDLEWVEILLGDEFFSRQPPKSAGREEFGGAYVERLLHAGRARGLAPAALLATAVELTARGVVLACSQIAPQRVDALYVTGGGRRNGALMRRFAALLQPIRVRGLEELGLDPDAKEAVDFAVLANEALLGHAGNLTQITGAERPCILGTLALSGFPVEPVGRT